MRCEKVSQLYRKAMCEPISVSGDQYSYLGANTKGEIKPDMDTLEYALASQLHL